jgi:uncharacterized membrane protein YphA (DoxX/SURF4 family)
VTRKSRGWATGGLGSPAQSPAPSADATSPADAGSATGVPSASGGLGAVGEPSRDGVARMERAGEIVAPWAPTVGRMLLGLVFVWFGWHEVVQPGRWTQYVPVIAENSRPATVLVAVHGWVLLALAAALLLGVAPRISAAIASVLLLEIVVSLLVTGFSATATRDAGVLGLAVVLTGCRHQRLVMRL